MEDLLKDIEETSTAEKFWTSILLLLWIGVLCYSFALFVTLQLIFPFLIILRVTEFEEEDNTTLLWIFTSVFVIIIFLIICLTDEVGKNIKINPIKKFNDWLNKF